MVSKVTGFSTIHQYNEYLQCLAASINMPFVNITIDVKAALNAFKFLWNKLEKCHLIRRNSPWTFPLHERELSSNLFD